MKSGAIFLKFWKLGSNYKTKSQIYPRHNSEIFENFGAMLISNNNFISAGAYMAIVMQEQAAANAFALAAAGKKKRK